MSDSEWKNIDKFALHFKIRKFCRKSRLVWLYLWLIIWLPLTTCNLGGLCVRLCVHGTKLFRKSIRNEVILLYAPIHLHLNGMHFVHVKWCTDNDWSMIAHGIRSILYLVSYCLSIGHRKRLAVINTFLSESFRYTKIRWENVNFAENENTRLKKEPKLVGVLKWSVL